jgi:hypothetical protein
MGRAEIAAVLDVTRNTVANWESEHPEFLRATTRASELSAGWWEKQGRVNITNRNFNAPAYSLQVRNRFPADWRDKQSLEHSGPNGVPIQVTQTLEDAELLERAAQLRNRLAVAMPAANGSNGKR